MTKHLLYSLTLGLLLSGGWAHADNAHVIMNGSTDDVQLAMESGEIQINKQDSRGNTSLHLATWNMGQAAQRLQQALDHRADVMEKSKAQITGAAIGGLVATPVAQWLYNWFKSGFVSTQRSAYSMDVLEGSHEAVARTGLVGEYNLQKFIFGVLLGSFAGSVWNNIDVDTKKLEKRALVGGLLATALVAANYGDNSQHESSSRQIATYGGLAGAGLIAGSDLLKQILQEAKTIAVETFTVGTGITPTISCIQVMNARNEFAQAVEKVNLLLTIDGIDTTLANEYGNTASDIAYDVTQQVTDKDILETVTALAHALG